MGFFGKLFDKKACSICGGEIGLLGNRKLEDGNMCKECAKKLSPWFSERRSSTVEQISNQIEYREANREKVASFRVTRTLGDSVKILLDEDAQTFMVTSARDLAAANPDVLEFSDVTGCLLDIEEDSTELMRDNAEGEEVSYDPPRYVYEYNFYITIQVRNPYFDEIRFKLNDSSVEIEQRGISGRGRFGYESGGYGGRDAERDPRYRQYKEMGDEIREILLQVRQQVRDDAAAAAAPKTVATCPFCGASGAPDAMGRCEFCGSSITG